MILHDFYCVVYSKNNKFLIAFGENLKKVRKQQGFTQAELANDVDVEISQISRIERGIINTSISNVYEISKALKVDIETLFKF